MTKTLASKHHTVISKLHEIGETNVKELNKIVTNSGLYKIMDYLVKHGYVTFRYSKGDSNIYVKSFSLTEKGIDSINKKNRPKNLPYYLNRNGFTFTEARAIVQATEGKRVNCPACSHYMTKEWNDELLRWEWMCFDEHEMEMICQFKDIDTSDFSWKEMS